jgi:hypothetical protein
MRLAGKLALIPLVLAALLVPTAAASATQPAATAEASSAPPEALSVPLDASPAPLDAPSTAAPGSRDVILRRGMVVLGGWAAANIIAGSIGALVSDDPMQRGFWEVNALWNTVNLGLAGGTLIAAERRSDPTGSTALTLPEYRAASHRLEKVLLFNAGLDLGYMTLGGWLWERGSRGDGLAASDVSADRLAGWGQALVVQGAFLFLFDLVLADRLARDRLALDRLARDRRSLPEERLRGESR